MKLIDSDHIKDSVWCDVDRHFINGEEEQVDDVVIYKIHRSRAPNMFDYTREIIDSTHQTTGEVA